MTAPYEPWCHILSYRREGDTFRALHQQYVLTFYKNYLHEHPNHACRTEHDGEQASYHHEHQAMHAIR